MDARAPLPVQSIPSSGAIAAFAAAAAVLSAAFPLPVYLVTLAAFGLAHVVTELRYLDVRFAGRWPMRTVLPLFALLSAVVVLRAALVAGSISAAVERPIELLLVAALALVALPVLARGGLLRGAVGLALVLVPLAGAWIDPATALVAFAVLHNVTPALFVAERVDSREPAERRRGLAASVACFGVAPLVVALAARALAHGATIDSNHVVAFVPRAWIDTSIALPLFAAATYLQCMHYGAVLLVLPRLARGRTPRVRTIVRWPAPRSFVALVAIASLALAPWYLRSFGDARAAYGVLASVHAWIEIPILLLALGAARAPLARPALATS